MSADAPDPDPRPRRDPRDPRSATTSARSSAMPSSGRRARLPLRRDDVLVVTQKIVSKAEGAVVDLTTVEPRPEADRVRRARGTATRARSRSSCARPAGSSGWTNGVLITETPHGFVCANGGVDASNVGPESGSIVTLLPRRSRRVGRRGSGAAVRDALRRRRPGHRVRLVRPAVALGHRRRRDRRLGPAAARRPARQSRTPTAG